MIENYVRWNEDIGEWQLKCIAYTGNNIRKAQATTEVESDKDVSNICFLLFLNFYKFFKN